MMLNWPHRLSTNSRISHALRARLIQAPRLTARVVHSGAPHVAHVFAFKGAARRTVHYTRVVPQKQIRVFGPLFVTLCHQSHVQWGSMKGTASRDWEMCLRERIGMRDGRCGDLTSIATMYFGSHACLYSVEMSWADLAAETPSMWWTCEAM